MTKQQRRFRLIDFFKRKSAKQTSVNLEAQDNMDSLDSMILSGDQQGNFYAHGTITVTVDSHISGTIATTNGIIKGKITGDITCTGELLVEPTAIIEGNITAKTIDIRPGSIIHGTFTHLAATDASEPSDYIPIDLPEVLQPIRNEAASRSLRQQLPIDKQPTGWW